MRCTDFLHVYSDYRDGSLSDRGLAYAAQQHLRKCPTCARYDQVIRRGINLLRTAPQIDPSPNFHRTLGRRLRAESSLLPFPKTGRLAASLLVAAGITLLILEGVAPAPTDQAAPLPRAEVIANPGPPFVGFEPGSVLATSASFTELEDADSAARTAAVAP